MTVEDDRIRNACGVFMGKHHTFGEQIAGVLRADDAWRAAHPTISKMETVDGGEERDVEPKLPDGVRLSGENYAVRDPIVSGGNQWDVLYVWWTPDQLEAIAKHKRWRQRQAKAEVREVTREMVIAYETAHDNCPYDSYSKKLAGIAAALAAQGKHD